MISFEKPEYKIAEYVESNHYGKFELEPLERGFAITIGNGPIPQNMSKIVSPSLTLSLTRFLSVASLGEK